MKRLFVMILFSLPFCIPSHLLAQDKTGTVDLFMGVDFNYRDIYFNNRVYDVLINQMEYGISLGSGRTSTCADS